MLSISTSRGRHNPRIVVSDPHSCTGNVLEAGISLSKIERCLTWILLVLVSTNPILAERKRARIPSHLLRESRPLIRRFNSSVRSFLQSFYTNFLIFILVCILFPILSIQIRPPFLLVFNLNVASNNIFRTRVLYF